jgi:hypothetical protein
MGYFLLGGLFGWFVSDLQDWLVAKIKNVLERKS